MTVKELIDLLNQCDPTATIRVKAFPTLDTVDVKNIRIYTTQYSLPTGVLSNKFNYITLET